jgi:hypothetical protein
MLPNGNRHPPNHTVPKELGGEALLALEDKAMSLQGRKIPIVIKWIRMWYWAKRIC